MNRRSERAANAERRRTRHTATIWVSQRERSSWFFVLTEELPERRGHRRADARFSKEHPIVSTLGQGAGYLAPSALPELWIAKSAAQFPRIALTSLPERLAKIGNGDDLTEVVQDGKVRVPGFVGLNVAAHVALLSPS
jgi:hypothetical protein